MYTYKRLRKIRKNSVSWYDTYRTKYLCFLTWFRKKTFLVCKLTLSLFKKEAVGRRNGRFVFRVIRRVISNCSGEKRTKKNGIHYAQCSCTSQHHKFRSNGMRAYSLHMCMCTNTFLGESLHIVRVTDTFNFCFATRYLYFFIVKSWIARPISNRCYHNDTFFYSDSLTNYLKGINDLHLDYYLWILM